MLLFAGADIGRTKPLGVSRTLDALLLSSQINTQRATRLCLRSVRLKRVEVLFVVSFDADGIWRINQFDSAFAKIFGVPRSKDCDVTQFKLSLAFATRLASAMSRCAENGQSVKLDVPVRIAGHVHHWEFWLEPSHGSGALPSHILGHGTDVTSRRKTVRDLNRLTKKLLNA